MSKLTISIGLVLVVLALRVERAATFPTSLEQQQQQQHQPQHQLLQQLWSRVNRDRADNIDNLKHHLSHYLSVSLSFETFQEIQTYH